MRGCDWPRISRKIGHRQIAGGQKREQAVGASCSPAAFNTIHQCVQTERHCSAVPRKPNQDIKISLCRIDRRSMQA